MKSSAVPIPVHGIGSLSILYWLIDIVITDVSMVYEHLRSGWYAVMRES